MPRGSSLASVALSESGETGDVRKRKSGTKGKIKECISKGGNGRG